ncbi:hypothetical protein G6F65_013591 [Rhizopus arrhizus]|nr:hypothetical protein G6F65_013591 [Rhizopus arrhizus]
MNEFVQQNLKDCYFDVSFDVVEWNTLFTNWRKGAKDPSANGSDAINVSFAAMDPFFAIVRFVSTKTFPPTSNNWGYFGNAEIDGLIKDARTTFTPTERDAALAKLHARVVEEAPPRAGSSISPRCRWIDPERGKDGARRGVLPALAGDAYAVLHFPARGVRPAHHGGGRAALFPGDPPGARRSAGIHPAARRISRPAAATDAALRLRSSARRAVRGLAVARAAWRSGHLDRYRPPRCGRSAERRGQYAAVGLSGDDAGFCRGSVPGFRGRLLPQLADGPRRLVRVRRRRQRAALLAGHGAGHRVLDPTDVAAAYRRGPGRFGGVGGGLGAFPPHDPARRDHVGDPDGHHRPHRARAGGRDPVAGIRGGAARARADRPGRLPARGQELRAHRAGRDGPAAGLPAGRLHSDRNRLFLAGHGLSAQRSHLPARPAAAAGHDPGAGAVLRGLEPGRRHPARPVRPAYRKELIA